MSKIKILSFADGSKTLGEMIQRSGMDANIRKIRRPSRRGRRASLRSHQSGARGNHLVRMVKRNQEEAAKLRSIGIDLRREPKKATN